VLIGHEEDITHVIEISPGVIASASEDTTVKLWELASGISIMTMAEHTGDVKRLAISKREDNSLCSVSWDGTLKLWNTYTGECIMTVQAAQAIYSLAVITHDRVFAGLYYGKIQQLRLPTRYQHNSRMWIDKTINIHP